MILVVFLRFLAFLKSAENARNFPNLNKPTLYLTDFDDFSVVQELTVSAFKRRQARQNPLGIRLIRDHVLVKKSKKKNIPHI